MKTALVGKFKDGVMIKGRAAKIIAERCNDGLKEIKVALSKSKKASFTFERTTRVRVHQPTLMDPYEKRFVYVNTTERGDDGLFARKDINANELVAYYGGTLSPVENSCIPIHSNLTGHER